MGRIYEHIERYTLNILIPSLIALAILLSNKHKNGKLKLANILNDILTTIGVPYLFQDLIFAYIPENSIVISAALVAFLSHRLVEFVINVFDLNRALKIITDAVIDTIRNMIKK